MFESVRRNVSFRTIIVVVLAFTVLVPALVGVAAAHDGSGNPYDCSTKTDSTDPTKQECNEHKLVEHKLSPIGDFIILVLAGVAVPNGAYGFFEWMTAGSNTEKDRKGRKRIRNTFIALGGAAIIKVAVELFGTFVGLGG